MSFNEQDIQYFAPSVFTTQPHERVSTRYLPIPTIEVIRQIIHLKQFSLLNR